MYNSDVISDHSTSMTDHLNGALTKNIIIHVLPAALLAFLDNFFIHRYEKVLLSYFYTYPYKSNHMRFNPEHKLLIYMFFYQTVSRPCVQAK